MQNPTALLQKKLMSECGLEFVKLTDVSGTCSWVCFYGPSVVAKDKTLGKCIRLAAKEVGE